MVSADSAQVPPVPMPNTEVKLSSAENTWMETSWEDREVLTFYFCCGCATAFLLYKCEIFVGVAKPLEMDFYGLYNVFIIYVRNVNEKEFFD